MKKNNNTLKELRILARFCSFRYTKFVILFGLLFHFFYSLLHHYGLKAFYLIVLLLALPPLLSFFFGHLSDNKEASGLPENSVFTCLLSHYRFSEKRFYGESFSFAIQILAMTMWQKQNNLHPIELAWYNYYPLFLMVSSVVCMILIYFFFRFYLPRKLLKHDY